MLKNSKLAFIFVIFFSGMYLTQSAFGEEKWIEIEKLPSFRSDFSSGVIGNDIYLVAGLDKNNHAQNSVSVFNTETMEYREIAPLPTLLHHQGSAVFENKLYVFGGGSAFGQQSDFLGVYDPTTNSWEVLEKMPTARWALTGQFVNGKLYTFGGVGGLDKVEIYDPKTNQWTSGAKMPTAREHHQSVVFNDKIYVFGGRGGDQGDNFANEVYEPATDSWEILEDMPTGRAGAYAAVLGDKIFVMGGEGGYIHPENEAYDPKTNSWQKQLDMKTPRHGLVAETIDGKIFTFGGGLYNGGGQSDVAEIYFNSDFIPTEQEPEKPIENKKIEEEQEIEEEIKDQVQISKISKTGDVILEIIADKPKLGKPSMIEITFIDSEKQEIVQNINFDLEIFQNEIKISEFEKQYSSSGIVKYQTESLSSEDSLNIKVEILGIGLEGFESQWTGSKGDTIEATIVPEFSQILIVVFSLSIIIALSTKYANSRLQFLPN